MKNLVGLLIFTTLLTSAVSANSWRVLATIPNASHSEVISTVIPSTFKFDTTCQHQLRLKQDTANMYMYFISRAESFWNPLITTGTLPNIMTTITGGYISFSRGTACRSTPNGQTPVYSGQSECKDAAVTFGILPANSPSNQTANPVLKVDVTSFRTAGFSAYPVPSQFILEEQCFNSAVSPQSPQ